MLRKFMIDREIVSVEPDAKVSDAARKMAKHNVGAVLVLEANKPRGIVTDRDIVIRCLAGNLDVNDTAVENILTESVEFCTESDGIYNVIEKMNKAHVRRMPVVDAEGAAIGIVSFGDLVGFLARELTLLSETTTAGGEQTQKFKEAA